MQGLNYKIMNGRDILQIKNRLYRLISLYDKMQRSCHPFFGTILECYKRSKYFSKEVIYADSSCGSRMERLA